MATLIRRAAKRRLARDDGRQADEHGQPKSSHESGAAVCKQAAQQPRRGAGMSAERRREVGPPSSASSLR